MKRKEKKEKERKEQERKEKTITITSNLYLLFNLMVMDHGT
jgi:hypothetical protein